MEDLTCRIFGDLVGCVSKVEDDLYIGGNSEEDLLENFKVVLHRLRQYNLKLSFHKTVIAPKSTGILGWNWSQGQLQASLYQLSLLSGCHKPITVSAMRSFIGS